MHVVQAYQWVGELHTKAPKLRTCLYYGKDRKDNFPPSLLSRYDVVVTTYETVVGEKGFQDDIVGKLLLESGNVRYSVMRLCHNLLFLHTFWHLKDGLA